MKNVIKDDMPKNGKLYLNDGCYLTNVPYDALDKIRADRGLAKEPHFDIAFDSANSFLPTILAGMNRFNRVILRIDQAREKRFYREDRGFYIELESGSTQTDFRLSSLKKAVKAGYDQTKAVLPLLLSKLEKQTQLFSQK